MSKGESDRFLRTRLLLGDEAVERLELTRVTVVGLGAVGSYAVEGLARSGVGHLRVVDFDRVNLTNINRQLYALESTQGMLKVEAARARIKDINPACEVEALPVFAEADTMDQILEPAPDILIDAIDSVGPKIELLASAIKRNIPVVSSMGAALRLDPLRIKIDNIFHTHSCPLAKQLRKHIRKVNQSADVTCVYSDEPVPGPLENADELLPAEVSEKGRKRRVLGSMSTLTGIFGLYIATEAIRRLRCR